MHLRGCEAQKGFDYSYTSLGGRICHKLQHKYDRVRGVAGIRNMTNSLVLRHVQQGGYFEGHVFRSMSERLEWLKKNERPSSRIICFAKPVGAVRRIIGMLTIITRTLGDKVIDATIETARVEKSKKVKTPLVAYTHG